MLAHDKLEKADKREQILLSAEDLFAEKGFDGTSVRDIAQHANVNLAMISYYFGSKEKLLEILVEERGASSYIRLEELNRDALLTPWEKMDKLIDFYAEKILGNYRMHCIMTHQYTSSRSTEIKDAIMRIKLRNLELIKKIIVDGQRRKLFRKVDPELTMASVMGTLSQVTNSRSLYSRIFKVDETDEQAYLKKMMPRLKTHLKQLMRAHLDIKNEYKETN